MPLIVKTGRFAGLGPLLALALTVLLAAPQPADARELLDRYDAWEAFSHGEGNERMCFIASVPTRDQGNYNQRGEIQASVTHLPNINVRDEFSIAAGYEYRDGSEVEVRIGGNKYYLFTQGENAWARDKETDEAIIRAMRRGRTMRVRGVSWRGTRTTDTYSLIGFTDAYDRALRACDLN